jgi:hypothetical protein
MPRFSLKTLLIGVAVFPLALLGFFHAPFAAAFVVTMIIVLWVHAVVVLLECDGALRAFARGYVCAALIYASVAYSVGPSMLLREQILGVFQPLIRTGLSLYPNLDTESALPSYLWVAHSYLCVIFGIVGGWFATWLYDRRQEGSQPNTEMSENP